MYRTDLDEQSTCKYKETVFNCKEKAKDLKTHLRSWFICPLQMVFSGTVLKVLGLAN